MKKLFIVCFLMAVLMGCTGKEGPAGPSGTSGAQTFQATFQNGVFPTSSYSGELDTWLLGNSNATENASPYLEVNSGVALANYARTILQFDISSLPVNATIVSAEVCLKLESATNVGSSPATIGLHNLASSTFSGCHWAFNASWTSTGLTGWSACTGDYSADQLGYINPTTMSTVVLTSAVNGTSKVYKWNIDPAVVQSWLTSATNNNGLILKNEGEFSDTSSNSVGFYPYNDATATNHPLLVIAYQ